MYKKGDLFSNEVSIVSVCERESVCMWSRGGVRWWVGREIGISVGIK